MSATADSAAAAVRAATATAADSATTDGPTAGVVTRTAFDGDDDDGGKAYFTGTHRACPPAQTWDRIAPLLPAAGVTRIADVTWLDDIGIPVYQAISPANRYLSVYQGKGLDHISAKVSAAMEAIERLHGAHLDTRPDHTGTAGDVEPGLGYRLDELTLRPRHCLNPATRLDWRAAVRLDDGGRTLVPLECLSLDRRVRPRWHPPLFAPTSNGLAAGNNRYEAIVHGLYEVIERDAIHRNTPAGPAFAIDPATVAGPAAGLLERYRAAGVRVGIGVLATPLNLPCFSVAIVSDGFPLPVYGYGCHLDAQVALCRALTEAAQVRVSVIAGARDDLDDRLYARLRRTMAGPAAPAPPDDRPKTGFDAVDSVRVPGHRAEAALLADRIVAVTGRSPLVVDHTRPELGVPVVHMICPGLTMPAAL
ncbi:YcaO-like family protein [Streptomyces sp. NPDC090052]|uniref:YcaO-like family protein n=1 Tax=unclassified Streptomyces TaxID=2593676 RepID=UPI0037FAA916|nr:YcaO-like family protein [Streptomyces sp. NBC_00963]